MTGREIAPVRRPEPEPDQPWLRRKAWPSRGMMIKDTSPANTGCQRRLPLPTATTALFTFFPLPFSTMSQVSTLPSSSALNHSSGPSTTMPPDSSTDPAELLRRAALSSRKLKRRKLNATAPFSRPLSRPFASTPSISLDYGQEEPSSTTSTPQEPPSPVLARAPTPAQALTPSSPPRPVQRDGSSGAAARTPLDDDVSMREEGEISDNEDPPFRPLSKPIPPPITVTAAIYPDVKLEASGSVHSPPFGVVSRSPSVKIEDACQHAVSSAYVTTPVARPSMEGHSVAPKPSETFRLETSLYVLDHDHVRPGLSCAYTSFFVVVGVV